MDPREKGRFCGDCRKVVHDLSKLREKDARKLVASSRTEGLCIRYLHDEHGNIWFSDTGLMRTEGLLRKVAAVAALAAAPVLTACMGASPYDSSYTPVTEREDGGADASTPDLVDAGSIVVEHADAAADAATDGETDAGGETILR